MSNPLDRSAEQAKKFFRPNPFQSPQGANPYGESRPAGEPPFDTGTEPAARANVYAAPSGAGEAGPAYQVQFVTTEASRGGFLLVLAGLGCCLAAWPTVLGTYQNFFASLISPFVFVSLGATIPAFALAYRDLGAMANGSMDSNSRALTQTAFWLGIAGLLIVVFYVAMMFDLPRQIPWRAIWPW